jgi:hypothetical protein
VRRVWDLFASDQAETVDASGGSALAGTASAMFE